jgi:hypothetical protein
MEELPERRTNSSIKPYLTFTEKDYEQRDKEGVKSA